MRREKEGRCVERNMHLLISTVFREINTLYLKAYCHRAFTCLISRYYLKIIHTFDLSLN